MHIDKLTEVICNLENKVIAETLTAVFKQPSHHVR